ncbi:FecR family protein [Echinicola jeungdonensis]|uniref:FecR family protein n=1 Tax=Echinicola jeungdonensis TaxID=709343 RepID=A0ABV5J373_9BACT|nr:FecR family protein [Echinicola jeungdonensis]MDN3668919.1 FecR family protein [Echinicola jeungdonensis]
MKKYSEFEIEDFLVDEFFVRWAKSSNKEEEHFWQRWMENNPEKRGTVMEAFYIINSLNYKDELKVSDQEHIDLFESILSHDLEEDEKEPKGRKQRNVFLALRRIAAVILVFFCAYFGFKTMFPSSKGTPEKVEQIVKVNPAGQKSQMKLSDGTIVHLNSESKLTFPKKFNDSIRYVALEGEAFFEVEENKEKPFIVQVDGIEIKVLGTSFNVKKEEEVSVALVSGKVAVKDTKGKEVLLSPNEMVTYQKDGEYSKSGFDPFETIGWKDKYLVFRGDDFLEVKRKLEKWYGVEIIRERPLQKDWSYTGQYYHETLERVLEGISATSEFEYKIDKNQVIINPNP